MPAPRFTPLHVHSYYSLLEGVDSLDTLLSRAAARGYQTLVLTDTNNLYGAVAFVNAAQKHGVRPILGACLRHERQRYTALIAEQAGYQSLCRILSRLHLGAGSGDPRTTSEEPHTTDSLTDLLAENAAGLHLLIDDLELLECGQRDAKRGTHHDSAIRNPHSSLTDAFA